MGMVIQARRCSFEQWIAWLFDHDARDSETFQESRDHLYWCDNSANREIGYITQAFENAETVFAPFSNAQLNYGFWYLISSSSNIMSGLLNPRVTWRERERCVGSFFSVYERLFAKRCSDELCHLGKKTDNPLNGVCYMWWDIFPFWGSVTGVSRIDDLFLEVSVKTLALESEACRESALHGLGHFPSRRDDVHSIVADFLERYPHISPELRGYALRAQYGGVL